jgi:flagellar assembly protein FliH
LSNATNGKELPHVSVDSLSTETVTQGQFDKGQYDPGHIDPVSQGPESQRALSTHHNASVSLWDLPVMEKEEDLKKEDVKTKLAKLEREAYEKGFEQGQKDGFALEKKKMEETGKQLEALFLEINNLKAQIYAESEEEVLKLCLAISKRIIHTEVQTNKEIIRNTVQSALKYVVDKRRIRIIIHPDDMEEVRRLLPDLSKLTKSGQFQITEDTLMEKGGCLIETGFGKVNARLDDQLDVIQEEIGRLFSKNHGPSHEMLP